MKELTFGSLFAGVGGIDIGMEKASWDCRFQVEWDKNCQQVLGYHWPDVPKWWDVSDVNGADLPPVDLITFGSPCQDLSVAGKRAGLQDGKRSSLFYEATRIIKEMREATNGQYPTWAIWENVAGAFSSSGGDDFEAVIREMADIGSHHIEWHCVDAQFFGVPQRRRRVFLIACFSPTILSRGGQEILPIGEGRRRNTSSRNKKRKDSSPTLTESIGTHSKLGSGQEVANTISASLYHHGSVVNQDANNGHLVLEPYVKSARAQSAEGFESWKDGDVAPTLNSFDNTGDSRATVVIAFSHTQGLDAQPSEDSTPTLREKGGGMAVAYDEPLIINATRVDDIRITTSPMNTLAARMGTGGNNVPFIAIPIQDGREIEKHQNGLGVGSEGDPSYTLDQTGAQAVAYGKPVIYPIQGTIIGRADTSGPQGSGIGEDGSPMYTLDTISAHGIAYEPFTATSFAQYEAGIGTLKASGGDIGGGSETLVLRVESNVAPTLRSGGDGGVPSSRGEHLVVEAYDEYNDSLGGDVHHALRAGTKQSTGVFTEEVVTGEPNLAVRRLTPIECEALMGWPRDHTLYRADGKLNSDTNRYKMCGNGVASPVAEFIGNHLREVHYGLFG